MTGSVRKVMTGSVCQVMTGLLHQVMTGSVRQVMTGSVRQVMTGSVRQVMPAWCHPAAMYCQVLYGVDSHPACCSNYLENMQCELDSRASTPFFNPIHHQQQPRVLQDKVRELPASALHNGCDTHVACRCGWV
jgi:hypothetical protein